MLGGIYAYTTSAAWFARLQYPVEPWADVAWITHGDVLSIPPFSTAAAKSTAVEGQRWITTGMAEYEPSAVTSLGRANLRSVTNKIDLALHESPTTKNEAAVITTIRNEPAAMRCPIDRVQSGSTPPSLYTNSNVDTIEQSPGRGVACDGDVACDGPPTSAAVKFVGNICDAIQRQW